jgi:hypothetical protein
MKTLRALLKQRRALVLFILGQIQMIGAVMGLVFIYHTGLSTLTVVTVGLTGCSTILSRSLKKRIYDHQRPESLAREQP